jgi:uncharacterized protein YggU (UPF0235/DUF167 family)
MSETSARLRLRVIPGASRSEVVGRYGEGWKVRVAAPAESGRANDAVLALLASALSVPRGCLSLAAGVSGRDKVIVLDGLSFEEAEARLSSNVRREQG